MYDVNYSLLKPADIGGALTTGFQTGRQTVMAEQAKGALSAYLANPQDQQAFGALAQYDPATATTMMTLMAKKAEAEREAAKTAMLGRIGSIGFEQPREAARMAASAGMPEIARQYLAMGKDEQEAAKARLTSAAPIAWGAKDLPYEQRKAFIQARSQGLLAGGWTPEQIASVDPTDEFLQDVLATELELKGVMDLEKVDYRALPEGATFEPFNQQGRYIGTNPDVMGTAGGGGSPAPASAPSGTMRFDVTPGARPTSTYRTAAHNKDVGGVANSYHTKRDAAGNAMAIDLVPPAGMSMAELHADLRRRNPDKDVINEGDHVHMEPAEGAVPYDGPERGNYYPQRNLTPEQIASGVDEDTVRTEAAAAIAAGAPPAAVAAAALERYGVKI